MTSIGYLLQMVSPIPIFWGGLWLLWDKRSNSPGILLGVGMGCLLVGWLLAGEW